MRMLILSTFVALYLGACTTPQIQAVESTPTLSAPEVTPEATLVETPAALIEGASNATILPDPTTATWVQVAGDFRRPLALTHANDERIFVVEQEGVIWILKNGERLTEPFLDLRQRVNDRSSEQGLLGLAFHPDYISNGYFFVNYTGSNGETRISQFSRSEDPNRADVNTEKLLLTIDQPYGNHNGGSIIFGPDGNLYIGTGDGGSGGDPLGNGQNLETLLGKILRLDIDTAQPYAIPTDNPFVQGGGLPETWAYGLRNPWRITFDTVSGDLYIADVGQNQWEEINYQPASSFGGENYGWNLREGAHTYTDGEADWEDPVAEYSHDIGCSVTGGEVVRDPRMPAWAGLYLYGDYCSGRIWGLLRAEDGAWQSQLLYESNFTISAFGQDSEGRIYLVDYHGGIYRLDPAL
jgi:glucose/arabinose dehydrogenase